MNDDAIRSLRERYDHLLDYLTASLHQAEARLRVEQDTIQSAGNTLDHARSTLLMTRVHHPSPGPTEIAGMRRQEATSEGAIPARDLSGDTSVTSH